MLQVFFKNDLTSVNIRTWVQINKVEQVVVKIICIVMRNTCTWTWTCTSSYKKGHLASFLSIWIYNKIYFWLNIMSCCIIKYFLFSKAISNFHVYIFIFKYIYIYIYIYEYNLFILINVEVVHVGEKNTWNYSFFTFWNSFMELLAKRNNQPSVKQNKTIHRPQKKAKKWYGLLLLLCHLEPK